MTDPKDKPKSEELLAARQEFLQMFKRGAEFTEELLKENERLRFRVAELGTRSAAPDRDGQLVHEMIEKIQRLESDRQELARRFKEVEAENKDFAARYVEVENENNNLLNIYVASYQLHSTLDFQEVLQIITEIVLNFVGAEVFAICLVGDKETELKPLVVEGLPREAAVLISGEGAVVGGVLRSGEPYFNKDTDDLQPVHVTADAPIVCIPLKIKDRVIGVISIHRFLPQKKKLQHVDYELFTLLAGHAATAIFSAKLYTESKRKLNTIQGLIDLVTS
jgi:transcriptional regulator with GAF, ATPase, and Fis domain